MSNKLKAIGAIGLLALAWLGIKNTETKNGPLFKKGEFGSPDYNKGKDDGRNGW